MLFPVAVIIGDVAAEWVAHLHRIQTGSEMAAPARIRLRTS